MAPIEYILIIIQILLLLAALFILIRMAKVVFSFKDILPFVPTSRQMAKKIAQLTNLKSDEIACDLGSGDGRLIIALGKIYKKNQIVGIEKSKYLRTLSKIKKKILLPFANSITIRDGDIYNENLNKYKVIVCFLTPKAIDKLRPAFQNMSNGSRILSYRFDIPKLENFNIEQITLKNNNIFIYTKTI